ncbi:MAG TPA: flavodoxin family protein [Methanocorpusculum sp.]|nr:flavodoxin family protein [Methanocorpusculum sp.]
MSSWIMYEHMKIIGLCGSASPKSSTKKLIEAALESAMKKGADVEFINIAKLDINGCIGCRECKKDQVIFCSQNDDMTGLYTKLNEADVILLGSPIYFGDISGQSKCFIDRTYAFFGPEGSKLKKGKKVAAIITQGYADEAHYLRAAELLTQGFGGCGAKILSPEFFGGLYNADEITDAQLSRAHALGEKLTE